MLGRLPGKPASPVAEGVLLIISLTTGIVTDLLADRAAVNALFAGDLALACPGLNTGEYLISLLLGQLSIFHALLHFGQ